MLKILIKLLFILIFLSPFHAYSGWLQPDTYEDCMLDETKNDSSDGRLFLAMESCKKRFPKLAKAANNRVSEISCFYIGGNNADEILKYRIEQKKVNWEVSESYDILYRTREKIIFPAKNVENKVLKDFNVEATLDTINGNLSYHITWKDKNNMIVSDDRIKFDCFEK